MSASAPALSNLDCKRLLESWGFVEDGGNGGHLVLRHSASSRRIQITAPGRHTDTPAFVLKKAADLLGISVDELRAGPKTRDNGNGHQATPDQATPLPLPAPPSDDVDDLGQELVELATDPSLSIQGRVIGVLERTRRALTVQRIAEITSLTRQQVTSALQNIVGEGKDVIRVRHGVYAFNLEREQLEREAEERQRLEDARERARTFRLECRDRHGRSLLRDSDDNLWIAIPAEPGWMPTHSE